MVEVNGTNVIQMSPWNKSEEQAQKMDGSDKNIRINNAIANDLATLGAMSTVMGSLFHIVMSMVTQKVREGTNFNVAKIKYLCEELNEEYMATTKIVESELMKKEGKSDVVQ